MRIMKDLEDRLVAGRLTAGGFWAAVTLGMVSVGLLAMDVSGVGGHGVAGRLGVFSAVMAMTAAMIWVGGICLRMVRVEVDVSRVLSRRVVTEVESASTRLRHELLAQRTQPVGMVEVPTECPFLTSDASVEAVPMQRAAAQRKRLW